MGKSGVATGPPWRIPIILSHDHFSYFCTSNNKECDASGKPGKQQSFII